MKTDEIMIEGCDELLREDGMPDEKRSIVENRKAFLMKLVK